MMKPKGPRRAPAKVYKPIRTISSLRESLQLALSGELSAIPPYLCALYSISDPSSAAYAAIRSVVIEEMLHMIQVANLMNAIGGSPSLTRNFVPSYPGYMVHRAVGGPFVQLQAFSPDLARSVFMEIEKPETSTRMPAVGDPFDTVGQFYRAIDEGFEYCTKRFPTLFRRPSASQLTETYFGAGGGRPVRVTNLSTARQAIKEITEQGEGAPSPKKPEQGEDPFGVYEHYGQRLDGTYGPILGRPWEMSHYLKFEKLADGKLAVPPTYPMRPNPSADSFSGYVRDLALLSDYVYTIMLKELENLFRTAREERFFTVVFPIMRFALRPLAILLMQTPLASAGNPSLGPNAGPPFRFRAVSSKRALAAAVELSSRATRLGPDYANTKSVLDEVTGILRVAFPKVSSRKIETQLEAS
jgi:hypothetical protein